jgi:hypothetical protein
VYRWTHLRSWSILNALTRGSRIHIVHLFCSNHDMESLLGNARTKSAQTVLIDEISFGSKPLSVLLRNMRKTIPADHKTTELKQSIMVSKGQTNVQKILETFSKESVTKRCNSTCFISSRTSKSYNQVSKCQTENFFTRGKTTFEQSLWMRTEPLLNFEFFEKFFLSQNLQTFSYSST